MLSFTPTQLADRLKTEGEKTIEFYKAIPSDKWNEQTYTDGENWNIHQILIHLVQAEDSVIRLIKYIVLGGPGAAEDFDLNGYNHKKVKEKQEDSPENLMALFADRRANTVAYVSQLTNTDLQKTGRHPFLGIAPVEEMLKLMFRHTQLHQRDIRKLLDQV
jgi:uncharacterized damage-inducible protein DinB